MNESNVAVREAARDLTVEILHALGIGSQEMDSQFGEGSAGAAIELRLTQFAGAVLEEAKPKPLAQCGPPTDQGPRPDKTPAEKHEPSETDDVCSEKYESCGRKA